MKKIPPKKEPKHYWNTIEVTVTQAAANAFTEAVLNTGVAVGQKRIMLIKKIICSYAADIATALAVGASTELFVSLSTQQGLAAQPALQDNGVVYHHAAQVAAGGDGATAAESPAFWKTENGFPSYVEFDDPIPVADDELSIYFDTTGFGAVSTAVIKLYYAIAEVSLEEALTILESYR